MADVVDKATLVWRPTGEALVWHKRPYYGEDGSVNYSARVPGSEYIIKMRELRGRRTFIVVGKRIVVPAGRCLGSMATDRANIVIRATDDGQAALDALADKLRNQHAALGQVLGVRS